MRRIHPVGEEFPKEGYLQPPENPPTPEKPVVHFEQMSAFYGVPGEFGFIMAGKDHGFEALSFVITETHPNGGPPLHTHNCEEAHIVLEGKVSYWIEDPVSHEERVFAAEGPYVARIPAGFPHTFMNAGSDIVNIIGAFPDADATIEIVGPNPLLPK